MALPVEASFALATAALLVGPVCVLWLSFRRLPGRRVLLIALALSVFLAADMAIFALTVSGGDAGDLAETIELVADVVMAALLAAAFLIPTRGGPAA